MIFILSMFCKNTFFLRGLKWNIPEGLDNIHFNVLKWEKLVNEICMFISKVKIVKENLAISASVHIYNAQTKGI